MRTRIGLLVWLAGILTLAWTEITWLRLAFSDGDSDWRFALLPIPPVLLLILGTWPTDRGLWFRRVSPALHGTVSA